MQMLDQLKKLQTLACKVEILLQELMISGQPIHRGNTAALLE